MEKPQPLTTPTVDLLTPSNRFVTASRLHGRLHRWRVVSFKYWWLPLLVLAAVVGPAYLLSADRPSVYESQAKLWLTGKLDLYEGRLYTEELVNFLGTQAELLRSSVVQARALARLKTQFPDAALVAPAARRAPRFLWLHRGKALLGQWLGVTADPATDSEPASPFQLKVAESPKSSIIELRATGLEPGPTRAFLNGLMEEYLKFKRESRQKATDRTVASVTEQVAQLAKDLQAQQERVHAFQSSNNVVFLQEQGNSASSYLASLNRQLASVRTELQLIQRLQPEQWLVLGSPASLADAPGIAGKEGAATLAGPQGDLFRAAQQAQLLQAKREELGRFLRPTHPKMCKLDQEIAVQEQLVQISRAEVLKQLNYRRQALQLESQNLEAAFQEWDGKAIDASRKLADYERLRQDQQRVQAAYEKLLGLIQTVDVSKTLDQENVGILEPASAARPSHPLLRNTLLACVGAAVLSLALFYLLGICDDRFASVTELAEHLSIEAVGQIPAVLLKPPKGELGIEMLERQRFEFLEAFRSVRSSLLLMPSAGPKPKKILITSSVPKEGKSTVALYLAATMALSGTRVLLIDADMRRASLHRSLGLRGSPGLAELLSEEASVEQAVVATGLEKLMLLPAGVARRNPGDLVWSAAWERLLHQVEAQFDFILIDSPPISATDDAAGLACKTDGVLFVVRAGYTPARLARPALDALRQRHLPILGLILNRAGATGSDYHEYQRHQRAYRWQPEPTPPKPALASNAGPVWKV